MSRTVVPLGALRRREARPRAGRMWFGTTFWGGREGGREGRRGEWVAREGG